MGCAERSDPPKVGGGEDQMTSDSEDAGLDDRLGGSLFGGQARSADYEAWAERLRAKRDKAKKRIAADRDPQPSTGPDYWSTDALFAESARVHESEQAVVSSPWEAQERIAQLAFELGMHDEINLANATEAYRKLAKLHHPDRYAGATVHIQDHHAGEMIRINNAYTALKKLLAAEP